MRLARIGLLLALPVAVATACGGSTKQGGALGGGDGGGASSSGASSGSSSSGSGGGSNVAPMIVDQGPGGAGSVDVPFVSVTICVPNTSNCQTIDHVSVDTGSSGLRIVSSVLKSGLSLPPKNANSGAALVECMQFDDGFTWGSVRLADVKIAGEVASNIPIQIIGDPAYTTIPTDCSSSGPEEDTVTDFGANGLIGINQIVPDCGDYCASSSPVPTGAYYACSSPTTCTAVAVPDAQQVGNPIAAFAADNNGASLTFPSVPAGGAATLSGQLVFGIGTQSNNALGSATVQTVDSSGNLTTVYKGTTLTASYLDSGTNSLSFDDSSITQCTDQQGFFCPGSPLSLTAQNKGLNGATVNVSFSVESADTLFANESYAVFDDLAGPAGNVAGQPGTFDWGFPFFIGRTVFVAIDGASTPGGKGPYFAY